MSSPSPMSDVAAVAAELPPLPERKGFRAFWARPAVQVAMISFTVFCSLSGVGGGGQVDPKAANDGNVALYSTFAVIGFASGAIINKIGARLALCLGACGYALYMGSLLSYNINANSGFVVGAGAILGICAGLLWTAQGSLTLAYATEATKGRLFALFWIIFNTGGVLGSAIELGLTYHSTTSTVSNAVYIVFMTIGAVGAFLPIFLVNPGTMVRTDGTRVIVPVHPTVKDQLVGLFKLLRNDYMIFLLFPYFLASNWMYTYQQNSYNGARFTLRTRSLNSLLYWGCQCVAAGCFGIAIDSTRFRRTTRAWGGFAFLLCLAMGVWGWAYHYQKSYDRADIDTTLSRIDFKDSAYPGRALLYIFFGVFDAIFQNYICSSPRVPSLSSSALPPPRANPPFTNPPSPPLRDPDWLLGAMTNLPSHLAYLVGLYKGVQSAGAAGAYRADANLEPYISELAVAWALAVAGLLFVVPVIALRIGDRTEEMVVEVGRGDAASTTSVGEDKKVHDEEAV
ncbi:hypothetical protein JCM1840_004500 [Sporobolomyces johnsonii]